MDSLNSTIRVLLVDFSKLYFEILQQPVETQGAKLVHAKNGAEALALVNSQEFAFIISVSRLPDISGIELVNGIRATPSHDRIPIVILTGSATETFSEASHAKGITEIFKKQDISELVFLHASFPGESKYPVWSRALCRR